MEDAKLGRPGGRGNGKCVSLSCRSSNSLPTGPVVTAALAVDYGNGLIRYHFGYTAQRFAIIAVVPRRVSLCLKCSIPNFKSI